MYPICFVTASYIPSEDHEAVSGCQRSSPDPTSGRSRIEVSVRRTAACAADMSHRLTRFPDETLRVFRSYLPPS